MDLKLAADNFFSPPILFFFLGMMATLLSVDLHVPKSLARFLSLYLLLVIGFDGGVQLAATSIGMQTVLPLVVAVCGALIIPLYAFFILRIRMKVPDSAAIAATYGSVSAVTFITATNLLANVGVSYGGYMVAALALMEAPAIIVGLFLVRQYDTGAHFSDDYGAVLRESFLNASVFLVLGSLFVGLVTGARGEAALHPFTHDIFKGMLSIFMLDMGIVAAKRMGDIGKKGVFLILFSILVPILNASVAILLGYALRFGIGDTLLLAVLFSSASYIAVPAAMRLAVPEANPSLYIPMALGITFPLNILLGLPVYLYVIRLIMR